MPTSPKTAKEIINDFQRKGPHWMYEEGPSDDTVVEWEEIEQFLLSSLRAAVEAVRPTNEEHKKSIEAPTDFHTESDVQKFMEGYTTCERHFLIEFNANVSRFFNDDPTSPPTPRN